jgi:RNA polymerase sigma-70 factor, ECF subfamily
MFAMSVRTDAELVAAVQRGDEGARRELFDRFYPKVLSWCRWLGKGRVDLHDAVADVFEVAYRRIGGFRGDSALTTWLYGIARNVVRSNARKAWFGRLTGLSPGARDGSLNPEEAFVAREAVAHVEEILMSLTEAKREMVMLVDVEGLSVDDAAKAAGVSRSTAGTRLFYGRREFYERYTARYGVPDGA